MNLPEEIGNQPINKTIASDYDGLTPDGSVALRGLFLIDREGVVRKHMVLPDGTIRSSVLYSILAEEWPQVKERLEAKMEF